MLIYLNKPEYPNTKEDFDRWASGGDCIRLWERLAEVLRDGHHAVWAPPRLLLWAADLRDLSITQRQALTRAHGEVTQPSVDLTAASCAMVLTGPNRSKEISGSFSGEEIRRDWRWFATLQRSFGQTSLVAENQNDAELMFWVARAMSVRQRPGSDNIGDELALDCVGGGGDTTGAELAASIQRGSPTLCVVDADMCYKKAPRGGTAKKAEAAMIGLKSPQLLPPHKLLAIDAYTIENIIPLELIHASCGTGKWVKPMARRGFFVQQVKVAPQGRAKAAVDPSLKYIKLVEATVKGLLDSAKGDKKRREYRVAAIARIRELDPDAPSSDDEALILSVGKLPQKIVATLNKNHDRKARPGNHPSAAHWLCAQLLASPDTFVEEWEHIARAVWSWGLRFPPILQSR